MNLKELTELITSQKVTSDVKTFMILASEESGDCYQICNADPELLFKLFLTASQDSPAVANAVKATANYLNNNSARTINLEPQKPKIVS